MMVFWYAKRSGALSGYLVVRMPAIMEKYSTHKRMSVTGPRFGTLQGWWQHLGFSSSGGCQASGTSSTMSTNSKSRIFFTSFGGSDVEKPWLVEAVGEALILVIGVVEVGAGPGLVRVVDGTISSEPLVEAPMGKSERGTRMPLECRMEGLFGRVAENETSVTGGSLGLGSNQSVNFLGANSNEVCPHRHAISNNKLLPCRHAGAAIALPHRHAGG